MPNENITKLHKNLSEKWDGFIVPIEQFELDMQDEAKRKRLWDNLSSKWDGFSVPFEQFSSDMAVDVKKKDSPEGSAQPLSQDGVGSGGNSKQVNPVTKLQQEQGLPKEEPTPVKKQQVDVNGIPLITVDQNKTVQDNVYKQAPKPNVLISEKNINEAKKAGEESDAIKVDLKAKKESYDASIKAIEVKAKIINDRFAKESQYLTERASDGGPNSEEAKAVLEEKRLQAQTELEALNEEAKALSEGFSSEYQAQVAEYEKKVNESGFFNPKIFLEQSMAVEGSTPYVPVEAEWAFRAIDNPARIENPIGGNGAVGASVMMIKDVKGAERPVIYPKVRLINGELRELSDKEAQKMAIDKMDYIDLGFANEEEALSYAKSLETSIDNFGNTELWDSKRKDYEEKEIRKNLSATLKGNKVILSELDKEIEKVKALDMKEYNQRQDAYAKSQASKSGGYAGLGAAMQTAANLGGTQYTAQLETLKAAKRITERTNDMLEGYVDDWNASFLDGITERGAVDLMFGSLVEMEDYIEVNKLADKFESGDPLTEEETKLFYAYSKMQEMTQIMQDRGSMSYEVAKGFMDMLPFITEMMLTAGVGAGVKKGVEKGIVGLVNKSISKKAAEKFAKKEFNDLFKKKVIEEGSESLVYRGLGTKIGAKAANVGTAATGTIAQAVIVPSTYAKTGERMAGEFEMNQQGMSVSDRQSGIEAYSRSVGENASEFLTETIFKTLGIEMSISKLFKNDKFLSASAVELKSLTNSSKNVIASKIKSKGAQLLENSPIKGVPEELSEEFLAGMVQPYITGEGSPEDFFEADNLIKTTLLVSMMSGAVSTIGGAANVSGKGIDIVRRNYENKVYSTLDEKQKSYLDNALMKQTVDDQMESLDLLLKDPSLSPLAKQAIVNMVYRHNVKISAAVAKNGEAYYIGNKVYKTESEFLTEVDKIVEKGDLPYMGWTNEETVRKVNEIVDGMATSEEIIKEDEVKNKEVEKTPVKGKEGEATIINYGTGDIILSPEQISQIEAVGGLNSTEGRKKAIGIKDKSDVVNHFENKSILDSKTAQDVEEGKGFKDDVQKESFIQSIDSEISDVETSQMSPEVKTALTDELTSLKEKALSEAKQKPLYQRQSAMDRVLGKITPVESIKAEKPKTESKPKETAKPKTESKETSKKKSSTRQEMEDSLYKMVEDGTMKPRKGQTKEGLKKEVKSSLEVYDAMIETASKVTGKSVEELNDKYGVEFKDGVTGELNQSNLSPVDRIAINYNINTSGFFNKNVSYDALKAALKKEGYELKTNSNGNGYYISKNGKRYRPSGRVLNQESQGTKGSITFIDGAKAIVGMFQGSDVSTILHEFAGGHLGRRILEDLATENEQFSADYEKVKKWAGVKDNVWSTKAEEKFARAWERYVRTGKAPTSALEEAFKVLKAALSDIYNTIKGSAIDITISKSVRTAFDNLLGAGFESEINLTNYKNKVNSHFKNSKFLEKGGKQGKMKKSKLGYDENGRMKILSAFNKYMFTGFSGVNYNFKNNETGRLSDEDLNKAIARNIDDRQKLIEEYNDTGSEKALSEIEALIKDFKILKTITAGKLSEFQISENINSLDEMLAGGVEGAMEEVKEMRKAILKGRDVVLESMAKFNSEVKKIENSKFLGKIFKPIWSEALFKQIQKSGKWAVGMNNFRSWVEQMGAIEGEAISLKNTVFKTIFGRINDSERKWQELKVGEEKFKKSLFSKVFGSEIKATRAIIDFEIRRDSGIEVDEPQFDEKTGKPLYDEEGNLVTKKGTMNMSKGQAISLYMHMMNDELAETIFMPVEFKGSTRLGMGLNRETAKKQVEEFIGPKGIQIADELIKRYPVLFEQANKIAKKATVYGTEARPVEGIFSGRVRRKGYKQDSNWDDYSAASLNPKSMISRVKNRLPIELTDAVATYEEYAEEMINFISFYEAKLELDGIFKNGAVNEAVASVFGKDFINHYETLMKTQIGKAKIEKGFIDKFQSKIIPALLLFALRAPVKQLTSIVSYGFDSDIRNNPLSMIKNMGVTLSGMNSELVQMIKEDPWVVLRGAKTSIGFEYDTTKNIKYSDKKTNEVLNYLKVGKNLASNEIDILSNLILKYTLEQGDKFPIIYGGAAYIKTKYEATTGKTLTNEEVKAFREGKKNQALQEAYDSWYSIAEPTNQSKNRSNRSHSRTNNEFVRAISMFTSQPYQYFLQGMKATVGMERALKNGDAKGFFNYMSIALSVTAANAMVQLISDDYKYKEGFEWNVFLSLVAGVPYGAIPVDSIEYYRGETSGDKTYDQRTYIQGIQAGINALKYFARYSKSRADNTSSSEKQTYLFIKSIAEATQLIGLPVPKILRMYESIEKIAKGEKTAENIVKLFSGVDLDADGKPLYKLLFDMSVEPREGETKKQYMDRMKEMESYLSERDRTSADKFDKTYESLYMLNRTVKVAKPEILNIVKASSHKDKVVKMYNTYKNLDISKSKIITEVRRAEEVNGYIDEKKSKSVQKSIDEIIRKFKLYDKIKGYGFTDDEADIIYTKFQEEDYIPSKQRMKKSLESAD